VAPGGAQPEQQGGLIVFASDRARRSRVGIAPASGGAFRLITPKAYASYTPDWGR
jgi:Tol biopolymer transport system component